MDNFERMTCKEAGSASSCVLDFINSTSDICIHGFILMRHGKIFAEKMYRNFKADKPQRLYSVTKTFVSAAIGMLYTEGKLSLDDKITELFGRKSEYKWVNDMTVRDCLMMATCYNGTTYKYTDPDWVETFLGGIPTHPPGTVFHYDTSGTHALGALVENITGMELMEYLRNKMGLSYDSDCVKSPEGYSWGGSGGIATMYDMARLAMLFMSGGILDGKRLIARDYAEAAVTKQIDSDSGFNNRWTKGYGYQIWMTEFGFAIFGAGSQYAFCVPDKELCFICTANTLGDDAKGRRIEEAFKRYILETLDKGIEDNYEDIRKLDSMKLDLPAVVNIDEHITGSGVYELKENPMGIFEISLDWDNECLNYKTNRGDKSLYFGRGEYRDTKLPETQYFGRQIGISANREYSCCAAGGWVEKNKCHIKVWVIDDHTGSVDITLVFKDDEISVCMRKNGEWYLDEYNGFAGGKKIIDRN